MTRARSVFLICLALAAAVGFWLAGPVFYRTFIGLDPSAFPAGPALERIGKLLLPDVGFSLAGLVLAFAIVLGFALASFFAVRAASRAKLDPSRRRFFPHASDYSGLYATASLPRRDG